MTINGGYEFRITLSRNSVTCSYDEPVRSNLRVEDGQINSDSLETIAVLEQWLKRWEWIASLDREHNRLLVPDTFKVLGNHLWRLAFNNGAPGLKLLEVHKKVSAYESDVAPPIRVRISFADDAREIAALPWEFLHYPGNARDRDFFLAAETSLVLGRYLDGFQEREGGFRPADDRLRVLFVLGLPPAAHFDDERKCFEELIEELKPESRQAGARASSAHPWGGYPIEIKSLDTWDPAMVIDRLTEFQEGEPPGPVDIVHLFAICNISPRPRLLLPEGQDGAFGWAEPERVVEVLTHFRENRPELVVLHLCDSREHEPDHFEQLAPAFIRAGIPAVLAMQYPMQPEYARKFLTTFYSSLARGEYLGQAVQAARHEMFIFHRGRYFGTPVLYMQSQVDGKFIEGRVSVADVPRREATAGRRRVSPPPGGGNSGLDLERHLLSELDKAQPELARAGREVRDWVRNQSWPSGELRPAGLEEAQQILRLGYRAFNHDVEADRIMRQLIASVALLDAPAQSGPQP